MKPPAFVGTSAPHSQHVGLISPIVVSCMSLGFRTPIQKFMDSLHASCEIAEVAKNGMTRMRAMTMLTEIWQLKLPDDQRNCVLLNYVNSSVLERTCDLG